MCWDEICGQQVSQGCCKLLCKHEIGPSGKRARKIGDGGGMESSLERCRGPCGELAVHSGNMSDNKLKCGSS